MTTSAGVTLTFATLWANSVVDKLMAFFLFSQKNRIWHFFQIVSTWDTLLEMSKHDFWGKIRKKHFKMSAENLTQNAKR